MSFPLFDPVICENGVIDSRPPIDAAAIDSAAGLLRAGQLVAFPTETVYGLGANALDAAAVARIYSVKGRPASSPLIVHVASIEMAKALVEKWPEPAERLTRKFWPGPLTIVVEKNPAIPPIVTAGLPTVGLRMPNHPIALALIRAAGVPLAAPSANRFTQLSPTTAAHVRAGLGSDVELILDGGPCAVGIESTVISLAGSRPALLRPGGLSRAEIESVIGPIVTASEISAGAHPSPGMHPRHYSPHARLILVRNGELSFQGEGAYLWRENPPSRPEIEAIRMPASAEDYAASLFEALHRSDIPGRDWIAVELPPAAPEWEAIHDRLRRAASR